MSKTNRITLTRLLTAYILIFYFIRFLLYLTPSGLQAPKMFYLDLDITYWANRLLHIPAIILDSNVQQVERARFRRVEALPDSSRGERGHGSSGR